MNATSGLNSRMSAAALLRAAAHPRQIAGHHPRRPPPDLSAFDRVERDVGLPRQLFLEAARFAHVADLHLGTRGGQALRRVRDRRRRTLSAWAGYGRLLSELAGCR